MEDLSKQFLNLADNIGENGDVKTHSNNVGKKVQPSKESKGSEEVKKNGEVSDVQSGTFEENVVRIPLKCNGKQTFFHLSKSILLFSNIENLSKCSFHDGLEVLGYDFQSEPSEYEKNCPNFILGGNFDEIPKLLLIDYYIIFRELGLQQPLRNIIEYVRNFKTFQDCYECFKPFVIGTENEIIQSWFSKKLAPLSEFEEKSFKTSIVLALFKKMKDITDEELDHMIFTIDEHVGFLYSQIKSCSANLDPFQHPDFGCSSNMDFGFEKMFELLGEERSSGKAVDRNGFKPVCGWHVNQKEEETVATESQGLTCNIKLKSNEDQSKEFLVHREVLMFRLNCFKSLFESSSNENTFLFPLPVDGLSILLDYCYESDFEILPNRVDLLIHLIAMSYFHKEKNLLVLSKKKLGELKISDSLAFKNNFLKAAHLLQNEDVGKIVTKELYGEEETEGEEMEKVEKKEKFSLLPSSAELNFLTKESIFSNERDKMTKELEFLRNENMELKKRIEKEEKAKKEGGGGASVKQIGGMSNEEKNRFLSFPIRKMEQKIKFKEMLKTEIIRSVTENLAWCKEKLQAKKEEEAMAFIGDKGKVDIVFATFKKQDKKKKKKKK